MSAATCVVKVITVGYFVYTSIETFMVENLNINMRFKLHLKKKRQQSFMRS